MGMIARKKPAQAQQADNEYIDDVHDEFKQSGEHFVISYSVDHIRDAKTRKDYDFVENPMVLLAMNIQLREPTRLNFL